MKIYKHENQGLVVHWTNYEDESQDGKARDTARENEEKFLASFIEKHPSIGLYEKHWIDKPPTEVDGIKYPGIFAVKAQITNLEDFPDLLAIAEPAFPT